MLTEADVLKFKKLYKAKFGEELNRDEAYRKLALLVRQMELIYQPVTKTQLEELRDKDEGGNVNGNGKLPSGK